MPELQNLGWANSWSETPEIVKKCREQSGHDVTGVDVWTQYRGLEHHVVTCKSCNYVYRYDYGD